MHKGPDQPPGEGSARFWFANGRNTFTRNVAVDNELGFYMHHLAKTWYEPPVFRVQQPDGSYRDEDPRGLPFVRFEGNEAHSSTGLYGVNLGEGVNRVGPDTRHPFSARETVRVDPCTLADSAAV